MYGKVLSKFSMSIFWWLFFSLPPSIKSLCRRCVFIIFFYSNIYIIPKLPPLIFIFILISFYLNIFCVGSTIWNGSYVISTHIEDIRSEFIYNPLIHPEIYFLPCLYIWVIFLFIFIYISIFTCIYIFNS